MEFTVSPSLPPIVSVLLVQFCFELDQSNSPTTQQQRGLVFAEQGTEFSLFTLTFSLLKSYAIFHPLQWVTQNCGEKRYFDELFGPPACQMSRHEKWNSLDLAFKDFHNCDCKMILILHRVRHSRVLVFTICWHKSIFPLIGYKMYFENNIIIGYRCHSATLH